MGCSNCSFSDSCVRISTKERDYLFHCDSVTTYDPGISEQPERLDMLRKFGYIKTDDYYTNIPVTANDVENFLATEGYSQLILSVSYACNFRCVYCYYGEAYPESRGHENEFMSMETARAAIDEYMRLLKKYKASQPRRQGSIVFYGGEPLLNFEVMKGCVEYVEKYYPDWDILWNATTNGSLMTKAVREFFAAHNFVINVSFDGPPEEHNRLRKTVDGKPTFDLVYSNIVEYSKLVKRPINCASVFDFKTNLVACADFFDNSEYVQLIAATPVKDSNGHYYDSFTESDIEFHKQQQNELVYRLLGDSVGDKDKLFSYASRFHIGAIGRYIETIPVVGNINGKLIKMTGGCVPGNKIHVVPDGKFYMCEKCLTTLPFGDVHNGFDFGQAAELVNKYNEHLEKTGCAKCKYRQVCHLCQSAVEVEDGYYVDPEKCKLTVKNSLERALTIAYTVMEKDPVWCRNTLAGYFEPIMNKSGG